MSRKLPKPNFRAAVFGMHHMGQVVMVQGPSEPEHCGLYVHVDDFEKFHAFQKEMDEFNDQAAKEPKEFPDL